MYLGDNNGKVSKTLASPWTVKERKLRKGEEVEGRRGRKGRGGEEKGNNRSTR